MSWWKTSKATWPIGGCGPGTGSWPRVSIRLARIRRSAPELAELSGQLLQPGPVPARGVAMVCELLTDGAGPLYRAACRDDLTARLAQAAHGLSS